MAFVGVFERAPLLLDGAGRQVLGVDVGIDDLVDLARPVDAGGVDLEPALRRVAANERRAAHIADGLDRLTGGQTLSHLDDCTLGVAEQQDVGAGVDQDRMANLVLPVVVVGDAAQRGLDAAEHDRHVLVGFLAALAVDQAGAVRPLARFAAGGISIVRADLLVRGVAVDHRVHVAGRDPEEEVGLAQLHEVGFAGPVRLGNDADAKALGFEQAPDDGHAKRRVVDVGVTGNDDDVAGVPAQLIHLFPAHRQEGRGPEAFGPVLGIVEQRRGGVHGGDRDSKKRARIIAQKIYRTRVPRSVKTRRAIGPGQL